MINFDADFKNMSVEDIDNWISEANNDLHNAYDEENYTYAKQLLLIIDAVKLILNKKLKNESFSSYYARKNYLFEATENTITLAEIYGIIEVTETMLKDVTVKYDLSGKIDGKTLTAIDPVVIDIAFKLPFLEDKQHITLTYNPVDFTDIDISDIPESDYTITDNYITFKNMENISNIVTCDFNETIEWPFEIEFDNAAAKKKYAKATNLIQQLIALLGKDQLIMKVKDYKSTHQTGSNKATREKKREADEIVRIRQRARSLNGKTKTQVFTEILSAIPGVKSVKAFDNDNDIYFKSFKIWLNNGNKVYEVLMARALSPYEINTLDKKPFICRPLNEPLLAQRFMDRAGVVGWLKNVIKASDSLTLSPRERSMRRLTGRSLNGSITDTYNTYVEEANKFIEGTSNMSVKELNDMYETLMNNESKLSDEQIDIIMDLDDKISDI